MNDIKYFTHFTNIENIESILENDYLYTNIERIENKIKYKGLCSTENNEEYSNENFCDEFPGVYMSYISKSDIKKKISYIGKVLLIFDKTLLQQKNYHINLVDNNGYISENITYFPFNLHKLPNKEDIEKFYKNIYGSTPSNEIIFHDKIHLSSLCEIWVKNIDIYNDLINKIPEKYHKIMKIKLFYEEDVKRPNNIILDKKSLPFYISLDYLRSGCYQILYPYKNKKQSSKNHYINIALIANIPLNVIYQNELYEPEKLNHYFIKNNLFLFYHKNRDLQNYDILNQYYDDDKYNYFMIILIFVILFILQFLILFLNYFF
jgi:hypothetical protein